MQISVIMFITLSAHNFIRRRSISTIAFVIFQKFYYFHNYNLRKRNVELITFSIYYFTDFIQYDKKMLMFSNLIHTLDKTECNYLDELKRCFYTDVKPSFYWVYMTFSTLFHLYRVDSSHIHDLWANKQVLG